MKFFDTWKENMRLKRLVKRLEGENSKHIYNLLQFEKRQKEFADRLEAVVANKQQAEKQAPMESFYNELTRTKNLAPSYMPNTGEQYIFHGGCHGCTQQEIQGVGFCTGCQYFDADWDLPDLNNEPPSRSDLKKQELKSLLAANRTSN